MCLEGEIYSQECYKLNKKVYRAIRHKNLKRLDKLLNSCDNIYKLNHFGDNMLVYALSNESTQIFDYLLKKININHIYRGTCYSIWINTIRNNRLSFNQIHDLLSMVDDINVTNQNGKTMLHEWINLIPYFPVGKLGFIDVLKILLEHGADPYIKDKTGKSALSSLIYQHIDERIDERIDKNNGRLYVMELLISENKISKTDKFIDVNDLSYIIEMNYYDKYDMIEFLLKHVTDINELNRHGDTILELARFHGDIDVIELLEMHGALPF